ncbi:MAG: hypothetical protein ACJZ59_01640 [Candidatus Thalassarchaeaceae archaeon]
MVDVDTALKSAAIDRRKAKKDRDSSKPKRPGGSVGIEPFDPEVFRTKEVADTYSMWLVLIGSILTALLMRFLIMPGMGEPGPSSLATASEFGPRSPNLTPPNPPR